MAKWITHKDKSMHGTRRVDSGQLWWIGYFKWTDRVYYFLGLPFWVRKFGETEYPITDLIRAACGG